jgi:hypothetical protein
MKRIYKYVSTYPTAETVKRKDRITEEELEFLVDEIEYLDFYIDGDKYTWDSEIPNVISISFIICTEEELQRIIDIDTKLHHDLDGYSTADDITKSVLYGLFDCDEYGFAHLALTNMLHDWRKDYLTENDLLDKISDYGIESLTQQEKDFLDTGILKSPWFYVEID